jgi:hypothetical protein
MTDGLNLTGFNETGEQSGSNNINLHLSDAPGTAFASSDMSTQGNAGLNQEGSYDMGTRGGETNAYPESENM